MSYLKKQFDILWKFTRCSGSRDEAFDELRAQYERPKRYYHTFDGHIEFCIRSFFKYGADKVVNPINVAWQLFLHDAVMDFDRSDNDAKSAQYAREFLTKYGVNTEVVEDIASAIICHDHKSKPYNDDTKVGLDIDLLILVQPQGVFDEYEQNIRKEYSFVEERVFKKRRSAILESFLQDRLRIFLTDYFHDNFEKQARANLRNSIKKLRT